MDHAIHLVNYTPMKWLDWKTPLEVRSGVIPDFTEYKVFRCATYVYLPEEVLAGMASNVCGRYKSFLVLFHF